MESATRSSNLDPNAVSKRAYEIWEALGCPDGAAEQTWAEAERQLKADAANANRKDAPKVATTVSSAAPAEAREESHREVTQPSSAPPPASPSETAAKKENTNNHRRSSRR